MYIATTLILLGFAVVYVGSFHLESLERQFTLGCPAAPSTSNYCIRCSSNTSCTRSQRCCPNSRKGFNCCARAVILPPTTGGDTATGGSSVAGTEGTTPGATGEQTPPTTTGTGR